ncbi:MULTISPECIES: flagellar basal body-associated protein FliL [Tatumella]|uniref:Flagellar protein FliL n=1 Tax=Tatumella punctata TaxID=399969 RepID=A0ABW1VQF3_9GAMM|nr:MULTISPECIES: flagellar basal body-associated protein FliL [unclassified Tatumella]MBS0856700.1 flagellar basal body-associated protein FliL [Tatumella sp. JGM16]MBS0878039.1 flagellar basal body-associated protein FliL [Tatumella sp. JGM82]MBS0891238.1 flagellar basal body-associated protein FliL [Tatumella sp. JGM94]MBS0902617.1 flagellar basal body-associated protein FliL [Tatumella sp. JGM100]MBS0912914.1 flagellar basal body-associated protein FliL [Tatumella sp. JGM91]
MTTLPRKKTAKRLLLSLMVIVILIAACTIAGYSFLKMKQSDPGTQKKTATVAALPPASPVFLALDAFTVNLPASTPDDEDKVLYAGFTLRLPDEATRNRLNQYLPEVRSRLILLLTSQNQRDLETEQGKHDLTGKIKQVLAPSFIPGQPPQVINDVLFTSFILR